MADSRLRRLLAFDRQTRRDSSQSPVFLHRRDRRFALDCRDRNQTPTVDRWLTHLGRVGQMRETSPASQPDKTLARWRRLLVAFSLAGIFLGVVSMAGLLYYEGGQRINLTGVLAFAALQSLLALITIWQSVANWQPWRALLRRLGLRHKDSPLTSLMPTMMARIAHTGGLCFGLAGVATLMVLVVIQDLAFGWSTTLATSVDGYHKFLSALAAPWHQLWPAAVPDTDLVAATRFFRATPESATANPGVWGQWWPFVVMAWSFYVVLPRLAGLFLAEVMLRTRARRALENHPGMMALEYRLETPTVDTGNENNDNTDTPDEATDSRCRELPASQALICWAGADDPELPDSLATGRMLITHAGGQRSLDDDQQAIERTADILRKQDSPAAILVTRGWEPPIAELADFITHALDHWPRKTRLALVPLAGGGAGLGQRQLDQWLRFAERLDTERVWISQPDPVSMQAGADNPQPEDLR